MSASDIDSATLANHPLSVFEKQHYTDTPLGKQQLSGRILNTLDFRPSPLVSRAAIHLVESHECNPSNELHYPWVCRAAASELLRMVLFLDRFYALCTSCPRRLCDHGDTRVHFCYPSCSISCFYLAWILGECCGIEDSGLHLRFDSDKPKLMSYVDAWLRLLYDDLGVEG